MVGPRIPTDGAEVQPNTSTSAQTAGLPLLESVGNEFNELDHEMVDAGQKEGYRMQIPRTAKVFSASRFSTILEIPSETGCAEYWLLQEGPEAMRNIDEASLVALKYVSAAQVVLIFEDKLYVSDMGEAHLPILRALLANQNTPVRIAQALKTITLMVTGWCDLTNNDHSRWVPTIGCISDALQFTYLIGLPFDSIINLGASVPNNKAKKIDFSLRRESVMRWLSGLSYVDWDEVYSHCSIDVEIELIAATHLALDRLHGFLRNGPVLSPVNGQALVVFVIQELLCGRQSDKGLLLATFVKFAHCVDRVAKSGVGELEWGLDRTNADHSGSAELGDIDAEVFFVRAFLRTVVPGKIESCVDLYVPQKSDGMCVVPQQLERTVFDVDERNEFWRRELGEFEPTPAPGVVRMKTLSKHSRATFQVTDTLLKELVYCDFYDWYEAYIEPDHPNYYPRIEGINGDYVCLRKGDGSDIKFWRWRSGFEPKFTAKTLPIVDPGQLDILGFHTPRTV